MGNRLRNLALWVIIVLLLLALFTLFQNPTLRTDAPDMSFSQFLSEVEQGHVRDVVIQGPHIHGTLANGRNFHSYGPNEQSWMQRLYGKGVSITIQPQQTELPWFVSLLVSWLPFFVLIGVWVFLSRQVHGAGGSWFMKAARSPDETESLKRKVEDLQRQLDQLSGKDKT
jgi:cell division protease FtsH